MENNFIQINDVVWINLGNGPVRKATYYRLMRGIFIWELTVAYGSHMQRESIEPSKVKSILSALGISDNRLGCSKDEWDNFWDEVNKYSNE
jgi:hypothetical protein